MPKMLFIYYFNSCSSICVKCYSCAIRMIGSLKDHGVDLTCSARLTSDHGREEGNANFSRVDLAILSSS